MDTIESQISFGLAHQEVFSLTSKGQGCTGARRETKGLDQATWQGVTFGQLSSLAQTPIHKELLSWATEFTGQITLLENWRVATNMELTCRHCMMGQTE